MLKARDVLVDGQHQAAVLPVCDHYCGSESLIQKSLQKQKQLGPIFDITCDCEDGAKVGEEIEHAHMVARMVTCTDNVWGRVGVRVHPIDHPLFETVLNIVLSEAPETLAYLVLPKPNSVSDALRFVDISQRTCANLGRKCPPMHALIESHGALRDVFAIAAIEGMACLSFGLMDFVSEHRGAIPGSAMTSPGQFEHPLVRRAKLEISAACHAAGIVPSHNVTTDFSTEAAAANDAKRARDEFGYQRMWSIHPKQIAAIVGAFAPSEHECETAFRILDQAAHADWGPTSFDGKLHDRASYRYWWHILERGKATGRWQPETAPAWD